SGGNPNLKPENSDNVGAGLILQPERFKGARLSLDYYRIRKTDNIATLTPQVLLANESEFPGRVIRDAPVANDPYSVGKITLIDVTSINLARAETQGLDLSLSYRAETAEHGTFDFMLLGTKIISFKQQSTLGAPFIERVNNGGPTPLRYRANATVA